MKKLISLKKTYCLRYHFRKLSVASSECRKLLINFEDGTTQNPDNNIPIVENMNMDQPPVANDEDAMEIENVGSQDLFADEEENNENMSVTKKEKLILEALERPVEHLIEDEENLPDCVRSSHRYRKIKHEFIDDYLETNFGDATVEELLNSLTPLPKYVKGSEVFRKRINILTDQEKSGKRLLKNINATLGLLQEGNTKETKKERKVLAASTYDHIFGYPKIKETKTIKHEAMILKTKLLSGESSDLNPKGRMTVDFFPGSVKKIAENCWRNRCTVVEPGNTQELKVL